MTFGIVASSRPITTAGYADAVLADSPYIYLRLGESSGTTAVDSSGNGYDGSYPNPGLALGSTGLIAGDSDTAVTADSTFERVLTSSLNDGWFNGQTAFTVEMWFQTSDSSSSMGLFGFFNSGSTEALHVKVNRNAADNAGDSGDVSFYVRDQDANILSRVSSAANVADGSPHHIVCTYDSGTSKIYLDGSEVSYGSDFTSGDGSPDNFGSIDYTPAIMMRNIRGTFVDQFYGTVDEFACYSGALSSSRVAAHYSAGT